MQHDQKITAMKKAERIRNGRTPDRTDVHNLNMNVMSTMSPNRKVHASRMSTKPSSHLNSLSRMSTMPLSSSNVMNTSKMTDTTSLNSTSNAELKKMQLENHNLELELEYSQYIASCAELILEKKNLKEAEESFGKTMLNLHKEIKGLLEKYKLLKIKIKDIQANSDLHDYIDIIGKNMKELISKLENHGIKEKLSHLENVLNRFNILQCENILLPSTTEDVTEFQKTLKDCSNILQQISDPIQADSTENLAENYEEFVRMYSDFTSIKKIVEEKICNLQVVILKTCSHLLSQCSEAEYN